MIGEILLRVLKSWIKQKLLMGPKTDLVAKPTQSASIVLLVGLLKNLRTSLNTVHNIMMQAMRNNPENASVSLSYLVARARSN